ncbi:MAG: AAA family ATPase, partial [Chloroflexales bacterium]|nr:AAA family ATPase [Chloroflexales bacterium]
MAKTRTIFVCQQCGSQQSRWMGKCPDCGTWDSLVEQVEQRATASVRARNNAPGDATSRAVPLRDVSVGGFERLPVLGSEFQRVLGGGLVPGSLVLIGGDPGIGKCLSASSRVLDPVSGAFLSITEWAKEARPVLSLNEATYRLGAQQVSAFHDQGVQPVVDVTTRLGRTLRCTPSHPVLTPEGWHVVGELLPGARIATPHALPYFGNEPMAEAEVKLIAYTLSDGSAHDSVGITNALPEVEQDVESIAAHFDMSVRTYTKVNNRAKQYRFVLPAGERNKARADIAAALGRVQDNLGWSWASWARAANVDAAMLYVWRRGEAAPSDEELQRLASAAEIPLDELAPAARERAQMTNPAARFLERVGLRGTTAATKTVPDVVFRLPRAQMALFLKVLFSCDGSVFVNEHGLAGISYSTISKRLAEDVQHLLLRFGFVSRLRTKHQRVNNEPYTAYEIQLLGVQEVKRFLAEIGIWGRDKAKARLAQMSLPELSSTQFDTVPTGSAFWDHLHDLTGGISLRLVSHQAGVTIRNRRHERPLCRSTVAAIADAYPSQHLDKLARSDVYWDEIASILPAGEERVYDLTVPGAANFVANDLILHNSTILLEAAAKFADTVGPALYISAEESAQQLKLRASRLGLDPEHLMVYSETSLDLALAQINELRPRLVIVDSIQTVYLEDVNSAAGSVSQVREGALRLLRLAKETGIPMFLVGHVTKEGAIAGPRVLEHIVDAVLYLEGDRFHQYRLLRGVKNRFGSTNEVGVFEMT